MDVPGHDQPLIITDAAVNIAPDLKAKVDIVQNAIDLAHALGQKEVRVAILSAMESVNPDVPSTLEAAALCKMADRGQITGALLDGPLALDNAISPEAAAIKKISSPVAGRATVLVVPDLEAGNMLAKSLSFLADADAAGIVLGAKVPIILTSRADEETARLASCAVAQLLVAARKARRLRGNPIGTAMAECIAVVNAGSSSMKFGIYDIEGDEPLLLRGQVEQIGVSPTLTASDDNGNDLASRSFPADGFGHAQAMNAIIELARELLPGSTVKGIGHRVVHGGTMFSIRGRSIGRDYRRARKACSARSPPPTAQFGAH